MVQRDTTVATPSGTSYRTGAGGRDAQVLVRSVLHAEGAKGLIRDGGSKRRAAVDALAKSMGGRVEAFYFAYGKTDALVIVDLPDSASATAVALTVGASGSVRAQDDGPDHPGGSGPGGEEDRQLSRSGREVGTAGRRPRRRQALEPATAGAARRTAPPPSRARPTSRETAGCPPGSAEPGRAPRARRPPAPRRPRRRAADAWRRRAPRRRAPRSGRRHRKPPGPRPGGRHRRFVRARRRSRVAPRRPG